MAARSFSVSLAAAVLLLFVVLSASPAQCRRGLLDQQVASAMRRHPSNNATTATTAVNSTALDDGSKFTVIFCVLRLCNNGRDCYCCETGDYCYYTRKECQANCDSCNPECPPRLPPQ